MSEIGVRGRPRTKLRRLGLAAILLLLIQAAVGMVVNLYVAIPIRHPGAHPSGYFGGSLRSVIWAITHGAPALAVHAALGVALVFIVIGIAINALRLRKRVGIVVWSTIAASVVIGAGFNGASFLDFNDSTSSLIMALLAFAAVACYSVVMFLLAGAPPSSE
ncbi:MAG: hypothetical protein JO262_21285 [Solirubrobacterales bacterium]|nr:hypothetical protein [Solirubrobacterales bacterium]